MIAPITSVLFPGDLVRPTITTNFGAQLICAGSSPDGGPLFCLRTSGANMQDCRKIAALLLFLSCACASAFAHHVAVVTHPENTAENLTSPDLAKLLKTETSKWPDGRTVVVVLNRNSEVALHILERLTNTPEGKAKSFLVSHKQSILLTDSDVEVLDAVASTPGAIGMVDVRAVDSRIKVLRIDGKLPLEKAYLPH
jgi:hypothetical protein